MKRYSAYLLPKRPNFTNEPIYGKLENSSSISTEILKSALYPYFTKSFSFSEIDKSKYHPFYYLYYYV